MAAVLRIARERVWSVGIPVLPAALSWIMLFGYQWAFFFVYRGHQPTVFSYYSGIVGDGFLIPSMNVAGFVILRQLSPLVPWKRLPLYLLLGFITAIGAFLIQARLEWVNWSMPTPYHWSEVGQFHFYVMTAEVTYLYLVFSTAVNNWRVLMLDPTARRSFAIGWTALGLFAASLAVDYVR